MLYLSLMRKQEISPESADSDFRGEARRMEEEHPSTFCPVCSARLEAHKCKLRCPTCGYYMSCSDYY